MDIEDANSKNSGHPAPPILDYRHLIVQKEHILRNGYSIDEPIDKPPPGLAWRRLDNGTWELYNTELKLQLESEDAQKKCSNEIDVRMTQKSSESLVRNFMLKTNCKDTTEAKFYLEEGSWDLGAATVAYMSDKEWELKGN